MMWMMMRGGKQTDSTGHDPAKTAELARLQAEIDALRTQQNPHPVPPSTVDA